MTIDKQPQFPSKKVKAPEPFNHTFYSVHSDTTKESFATAKEAAEAFARQDAKDMPAVYRTIPGYGCNTVAGTYRAMAKDGSRAMELHKWHDIKYRDFADPYEKAISQKESGSEPQKSHNTKPMERAR